MKNICLDLFWASEEADVVLRAYTHVHVYGFTCSNPPNKSINRYKFIWRPFKIPNYCSEKPKTVGKENQILCNPDIITPKIFLAALLVVLDDTSERDGMGLWC